MWLLKAIVRFHLFMFVTSHIETIKSATMTPSEVRIAVGGQRLVENFIS